MTGIFTRLSLQAVVLPAILATATAQERPREWSFLPSTNAYNPIPSPDGRKVAFVRTGRDGMRGTGGFGRSNLRSLVGIADSDGTLLSQTPLEDAFLAGWTPDGTALICYRDRRFSLVSVDGTGIREGRILVDRDSRVERVQYLPRTGRFIWVETGSGGSLIRDENGTILARYEFGLRWIVLSGDGQWLAAVSGGELVVLNLATRQWSDLGPIVVHPNPNWDYISPSWNPWFQDSSHLVFVSGGSVVVAAPDGTRRRTLGQAAGPGGLATPSPDGKQVAYVTFGPKEDRNGRTFWGNARVWLVSGDGRDPIAVTDENPDSIYTLRWLNQEEVIFDRFADQPFYSRARLWKADIPPPD